MTKRSSVQASNVEVPPLKKPLASAPARHEVSVVKNQAATPKLQGKSSTHEPHVGTKAFFKDFAASRDVVALVNMI